MAKTLFDTLNQGLQSASATTAPKATDNTAAAQKLLATKATGRAVTPGAGPSISSQAEKTTISQGQEAAKQKGLSQRLQQTGLGLQAKAQQHRFDIAEKQGREKIEAMTSDFQRRSDSILGDFERGVKKIGDQKHALDVEMMSFQSRLSNKKYLDSLEIQSKQAGLDSSIRFNESMARTVIGDDLGFLKDVLAYRKFMSGSDRDFQMEMGNMEIAMAMKAAEDSLKQQQSQAMYEGIGGLMSGGAQAYSAYSSGQDADAKASLAKNRAKNKYT